MTKIKDLKHIAIVLLTFQFVLISNLNYAQIETEIQHEGYKKQIFQMVSYFQSCLNILGDEETDMLDKDIIINQTYLKIFRDRNVQIEDDLIPNRKQPVNKDVQAYLKDVDFFYKSLIFSLEVQDITWNLNPQNKVYYKVTLLRKMKGIDLDGNEINETKQRFLEINLDEQKKDLKIVSYYTTKISEKEDIYAWWESLSLEWKKYFGKNISFEEGLTLADVISTMPDIKLKDSVKIKSKYYPLDNQNTINGLKRILLTEKLDLSNEKFFIELSPLNKFSELKQLDLSNTLTKNISEIRSCSKLEKLNISGTVVKSIESIKYLVNLKELNCSHTLIDSIESLVYLQNLTHLNISGTFVKSIKPLENIPTIEYLSIENCRINDITPLSKSKNLQFLNLKKSDVISLEPLSDNNLLTKINIENTFINDIMPLKNDSSLIMIYADGSKLTKSQIKQFLLLNPKCQVIFDSFELLQWWENLSLEWKSVLSNNIGHESKLDKEQLYQLISLKDLDISSIPIKDFSGIKHLSQLKKLIAKDLHLNSVKGIETLTELEYLDLSGSYISDYSPLIKLKNLQTLKLNKSDFSNLELLDSLKNLNYLELEKTKIDYQKIQTFDYEHPYVTIIYRTDYLNEWWNNLPIAWKDYFKSEILFNNPNSESLHKLVKIEKISIEDNLKINDIQPLSLFLNLKELSLIGTGITNLNMLTDFKKLIILRIPKNPIIDFQFLNSMPQLVELNISSLRINSIEFLNNTYNLEILNLSNIGIKNLKGMEKLTYLKYLDISNTKVSSLQPLKKLILLDNLICFNSGVSESNVNKFKKWRPTCNVIYY